MQRIKLALMLAILGLALPLAAAAQTASGQANISTTSGMSEYPQLALSGGTLFAVWGERQDGAIRVAANGGGGWTAAGEFAEGTKTAYQAPDITVTPDGTTHIVYSTGNQIYHRSLPRGGQWSGRTLVAEDNFANATRIAGSPDGSIWVIWRDADGTAIKYRRSTNGGASWNEGGEVARQSGNMIGNDLAIGPDGLPHVVWYLRSGGNNGNTVQTADWNGGWQVSNIGDTGGYVAEPAIFVDGRGVQHVAYRRQSGDNWIIQYVARAPGQGWGSPEGVRTTRGNAGYPPSIAVDANGGVHITWSELGNKGGRDVLYSYKLPGQTFVAPLNVSENPGGWNSRSTLLVTGDGPFITAHVVYQRGARGEDRDDVYHRTFSTGGQPVPAPEQPAPPPALGRTFPETGQTVSGRLLEYWDQNGALPVFGFPITPEAERRTLDGTFRTQIFERNRLELHPENQRPYDVLLGRLGGDLLYKQGRPWETLPREQPRAGCKFFAETQINLCEPFLSYWRAHGLDFGDPGVSERESLALFGLPLTGTATETNPDGWTGQTQWFERARFEFHPENQDPYKILLGRLGAEAGE